MMKIVKITFPGALCLVMSLMGSCTGRTADNMIPTGETVEVVIPTPDVTEDSIIANGETMSSGDDTAAVTSEADTVSDSDKGK